MKQPKISVIMPVYNTPKEYLREAIESILAQTYTDFEFIIVDDGSTDPNVKKTIQTYKDTRIKYFYKANSGVANSLNFAWKQAKGEYIARMDSDDISVPERFEKQISFLEEHPEISILGSWVEFFPDRGIWETLAYPKIFDFLEGSQIAHPSVMLRKIDFDKNDLKYDSAYHAEDYELWTRAVKVLKFANMQEVLLKYRISEQQCTSIKSQKMTKDNERIKENILNFMTSNPEFQKKLMDAITSPVKNISKTCKLFNLIPILTIHIGMKYTKCFLFGFIPFLKIKKKENK